MFLPSGGIKCWEPYLSTQWRNKMLFGAICFYPVGEQNVGSHIFLPSVVIKCFFGAIPFYPVAVGNVVWAIEWRNKMLLGVMWLYPAAEQNVMGAICFYPMVEQNVVMCRTVYFIPVTVWIIGIFIIPINVRNLHFSQQWRWRLLA